MFKTPSQGWGVRAMEYIPRNSIICSYVGEVFDGDEDDRRHTVRSTDRYVQTYPNREGAPVTPNAHLTIPTYTHSLYTKATVKKVLYVIDFVTFTMCSCRVSVLMM